MTIIAKIHIFFLSPECVCAVYHLICDLANNKNANTSESIYRLVGFFPNNDKNSHAISDVDNVKKNIGNSINLYECLLKCTYFWGLERI